MEVVGILTYQIVPAVSSRSTSQPIKSVPSSTTCGSIPKWTIIRVEISLTRPPSKRSKTSSRSHKTTGTRALIVRWHWSAIISACSTPASATPRSYRRLTSPTWIRMKRFSRTRRSSNNSSTRQRLRNSAKHQAPGLSFMRMIQSVPRRPPISVILSKLSLGTSEDMTRSKNRRTIAS